MFKNRQITVGFAKTPQTEGEPQTPAIDPEQIEEIARRSVLDLAKLTVASVGALMILQTALNIIEDKTTSDD